MSDAMTENFISAGLPRTCSTPNEIIEYILWSSISATKLLGTDIRRELPSSLCPDVELSQVSKLDLVTCSCNFPSTAFQINFGSAGFFSSSKFKSFAIDNL